MTDCFDEKALTIDMTRRQVLGLVAGASSAVVSGAFLPSFIGTARASSNEVTGNSLPAYSTSSPLLPVDSLTIDVITDNVSDSYVSKPLFAVSEFANVLRGGAKEISGENLLVANLGFGLRLTLEYEGKVRRMLFDTGPEGSIFLRNCHNLGITLKDIEHITVSHGHWDHMGALPETIKAIKDAGGKVTTHVNPGMFIERAVLLKSGQMVPLTQVPSIEKLEALGAQVVNDVSPQTFFDGHVYYSGEIPRVSSFEKGRNEHVCRRSVEAAWQPDPLLMDERMLIINVAWLGLVVFSSCSHAGIVNVCHEATRLFPETPIYCVMGGLHLGGEMEKIIPDTVSGLAQFNIRQLIVGHCTGWRALHALTNAYGNAVSQSAVGTTYTLTALDAGRPRQVTP